MAQKVTRQYTDCKGYTITRRYKGGSSPIALEATEARILALLAGNAEPFQGKQIARLLGRPYNGHIRSVLSGLRVSGKLSHIPAEGYTTNGGQT